MRRCCTVTVSLARGPAPGPVLPTGWPASTLGCGGGDGDGKANRDSSAGQLAPFLPEVGPTWAEWPAVLRGPLPLPSPPPPLSVYFINTFS